MWLRLAGNTVASVSEHCLAPLSEQHLVLLVCSDGLEYSFLAKPKDDLRKDYRLMDFAGTLNALLARTAGGCHCRAGLTVHY